MSIRQAEITGLPPGVEVRRSDRRRRTVSAFREAGQTVIVVPARMSNADARRHAIELTARLQRKQAGPVSSDGKLANRAGYLRGRFLPPGAPAPSSVRWSSAQQHRWGSCSSAEGSIRISDRMRPMPGYVLDYVLLHELAHLLVSDHGPSFESLLAPYPELGRARAFLDGVAFAGQNLAPADRESFCP